LACRARVTSDLWCAGGVVQSLCKNVEFVLSARPGWRGDRSWCTDCCKVGENFQHAEAAGIEMFALVWRFIALDILHLLDSSATGNANPLPHPKRLFPSTEDASKVAVSCIACANADVQGRICRSLTRNLARKPAQTRRRVLLSSASVCRRYLRGHGCWLVIVDRHGRGLKATFQVGLALIQIRKREVRRTDASALGKSTFDNLPGSTHARN